jgi:tRNA modification GTPase
MENVLYKLSSNDTICALSTPAGTGAIAMVRISGKDAFSLVSKVFRPFKRYKSIEDSEGYTILHGIIGKDEVIDEVLVSVFKSPNSYTGEDLLEISCHGSFYIQQKLIELLISEGARLANPGEFTLRAFLNGKFDLSQAEAVADLISCTTPASHDLALRQMRGGYSSKIAGLRRQLVDFASLLELELDFSEEDVEFADRGKFKQLVGEISEEIDSLLSSFKIGNVLKTGIPVAIIGKPNVGKSTLLNAILNEEKAIVSEIPGTTRDFIEDSIIISGVTFRFIDTAGLRHTDDTIESMGIERTYNQIRQAKVILYVLDLSETSVYELKEIIQDLKEQVNDEEKVFIPVVNKTDLISESPHHFADLSAMDALYISAKRKENINLIIDRLLDAVNMGQIGDQTIVSNSRHYEALDKSHAAMQAVSEGLEANLPTDLIAGELRMALHFLGEITGTVTNDELLANIFGKFCIGK